MDGDWLFKAENAVCELRVAAVLVAEGWILVQREVDGDEYALPGGHVKVGETLEDALKRELFEETGLRVACRRLCGARKASGSGMGSRRTALRFTIRLS